MSQGLDVGHRENIVSIIKYKLHPTGLWSDMNNLVYWSTLIGKICFITTLITQLIVLYMATGDSEKLFECFSVFSFCGIGFLKLNTLRSNCRRWHQLLLIAESVEKEQMNNDKIPHCEYDSDDEEVDVVTNRFQPYIQTYTKQFHTLSYRMSNIYYFTLIIFVSSPFVEYGYWKFYEDEEVDLPHVLPGWAPLDQFGVSGYLVTVTAELLAALYVVIVQVAFDLTVFGLMIFIGGQFTLLRDYAQDLGGRGKHLNLLEQRDVRAHFRIIYCHRILVLLDKSIAELDKLIRNILGIYFFVVTLTLCSVALRLSSEEMTLMQVFSLLQYTGASLTQLFLFCYYGDIVFQKSSTGMGEGPSGAAHWCLSPKTRRETLLLAYGMSCVRKLHAGPFISLDLPSFIQVVRTAYSYYAVLQK